MGNRVIFFIITASATSAILVFIPSFLGYELLVKDGDSLNSLSLSTALSSTSFRESLLCSISFLLLPIIEILGDLVPDEREKNILDLLLRLVRLLATFCPNLIIFVTQEFISYVSLYPAIYASQQIILLTVFSLIYLQHGSSVWRQGTVCSAFAFGIITIFCKCYSAYFYTAIISFISLSFIAITFSAWTIQFILFVRYIYNNYTQYSKKLSNSDYICCVHMCAQEIYALFFLVTSFTNDGLRWQSESTFQLCSHVYLLAFLNGFVSLYYDRLVRRNLSWTQVNRICASLSICLTNTCFNP